MTLQQAPGIHLSPQHWYYTKVSGVPGSFRRVAGSYVGFTLTARPVKVSGGGCLMSENTCTVIRVSYRQSSHGPRRHNSMTIGISPLGDVCEPMTQGLGNVKSTFWPSSCRRDFSVFALSGACACAACCALWKVKPLANLPQHSLSPCRP